MTALWKPSGTTTGISGSSNSIKNPTIIKPNNAIDDEKKTAEVVRMRAVA